LGTAGTPPALSRRTGRGGEWEGRFGPRRAISDQAALRRARRRETADLVRSAATVMAA
jgi:hypothetical protein